MATYWLSFAGPRPKPHISGFKGVCILDALDFGDAIQTAWDLEINPGGEVLGAKLSDEDAAKLPVRFWNLLLTKDEAEEAQAILDGLQ